MWTICILDTGGVEYRVEQREIKARMDTPAVRAVLDMGFERNLVMNTIGRRLRTSGKREKNIQE